MPHLIVRVGLFQPQPAVLHVLSDQDVAKRLFTEEESRISPDQGVYLFRVSPFQYRTLDAVTADALAREYGACLRAGVFRITLSRFGRSYAFQDGLKETA